MKLAFHGATSMKSSLPVDVMASARAGFKALEIWADKMDSYLHEHSLGELRSLFVSNGMEPASISSIEFIGFRGDSYKQIQDRCSYLCTVAEHISCPTVVVVPSPVPQVKGDAVLNLFIPWDEVVSEYVAVLRDLSGIAGAHGVRLAFEFLGFGWCTVRTPRGAYEIIEKADCNNVGLNFDACHFYGGGATLDEIDRLDPARIYSFHLDDMENVPKEGITDSRRLLPGDGVVPLWDICTHLKGIGYDGLCSIETFRPEYWEWDTYELAVKARDAALKVLTPHFKII